MAKSGRLNNCRSTMGCLWDHSHQIRSINPTAEAMVNEVIIPEANQSSSWPRSNTICRQPSAMVMRPRPSQSIRLLLGLASSPGVCNRKPIRNISAAPTGTLIRKTQRHSYVSVIQPPMEGPMAGANTTAMP